jgi:hypothetical protein
MAPESFGFSGALNADIAVEMRFGLGFGRF